MMVKERKRVLHIIGDIRVNSAILRRL